MTMSIIRQLIGLRPFSSEQIIRVGQLSVDDLTIVHRNQEDKVEILLTEYKETIETLRNWDRLIFQMLTIIGTVLAALLVFFSGGGSLILWGGFVALVLFWIFTYVNLVRLAEVRINVLIKIEQELGMIGHYQALRGEKSQRSHWIKLFFPLALAFVVGVLISVIIMDPATFERLYHEFVQWVTSVLG